MINIILLITVCNQNRQRIKNHVDNLYNQSLINNDIKFTPVFVFGKDGDTTGIPFDTIITDVEEKYSNLKLKLLASYKTVSEDYDFDFLIKIDDDTKVNLGQFKKEWVVGKDYVGRFIDGNISSKIILELEMFNMYKTIILNPQKFIETNYKFATGDCYILSKKAIQYINNHDCKYDNIFGEDRMFGFILKSDDIVKNDIKLTNEMTNKCNLQVTIDYFTIHPIHENVYQSLIDKAIDEQLSIIENKSLFNLSIRKMYLRELEDKIKNTVIDFMNSKKTIGLG